MIFSRYDAGVPLKLDVPHRNELNEWILYKNFSAGFAKSLHLCGEKEKKRKFFISSFLRSCVGTGKRYEAGAS